MRPKQTPDRLNAFFFLFSYFSNLTAQARKRNPRLVTHLLRQENLNFTSRLLLPTSKGHRSLWGLFLFFLGIAGFLLWRHSRRMEYSPDFLLFFCFRVYFPRVSAL